MQRNRLTQVQNTALASVEMLTDSASCIRVGMLLGASSALLAGAVQVNFPCQSLRAAEEPQACLETLHCERHQTGVAGSE